MKPYNPLISILACLFYLLFILGGVLPATAQGGDAYALAEAVNRVRSVNGLPPYNLDPILMSIAQGHSNYMASMGSVTHTGPGGSRPRDRAIAAGYGSGATVFVSENIAGGTNLTVDGAVSMWQGDAPHLNTMLGANYQDLGAGVASAGGVTYYTIDAGYVAGGSRSAQAATTTPGTPPPTLLPYFAVQTSTPNPDGSMTHEVRPGQNLSVIAQGYGISLAELLQLNGLNKDGMLIPGMKLVIRPANTLTPTPEVTNTYTPPPPQPTATHRPTRTPTPSAIAGAASAGFPSLTPTSRLANPAGTSDPLGNALLIGVGVVALTGVILVFLGGLLRRRA